MAYTVKKLSRLSGVSVRTLHFYDEIGLLKRAYYGDNGYRYYERPQLLALQQILFFRELGLPLSEIAKVLSRSDFDRIAALKSHRRLLEQRARDAERLIRTIDKTIATLEGRSTMKDDEVYLGFDRAKQEAYERELVEKYGEPVRKHIDESKERMKGWKKADFERVGAQSTAVLNGLVAAIEAGKSADDPQVQSLVRQHYEWVCHFWTPNREAYIGLGRLYVDHADFRRFYEPYHPGLAEFLAKAMRVYAEREL